MGVVYSWFSASGKRPIGEGLLNLAGILILCGPFLYWDASRALYLLTSLFALGYLIRQRIRLPREQLLYSLPIVGFVAAATLSWLVNGTTDSGWNIVTSRYALLLFAIPLVALFFAQYRSQRNHWFKFQAAALVLGCFALYEILVLGQPRAEGDDNAAIFGFAAALVTCVVLVAFPARRDHLNGMVVYLLSVAAGGTAVLLSGTRGAWLAVLVCLAIAANYMLERHSAVQRLLLFGTGLLVLGIITVAVPPVKTRFIDMVEIVSPYFDGSDEIEFSSVRYRVETWRAGWHIGRENLGFGVGPGNYPTQLSAYVAANPRLETLQRMRHAHNQYMQIFATMGLTGLLGLIGLLSAHLLLFARYLSRRYSPEVRRLALAGLLLVITYALLSITGVPLDRKKQIVIYAFSSASLWGCLLGALERRTG